MKIHAIIHASFEKLGVIEDWAKENEHALTSTHTYKGETLPASPSDFDFLIIMGGPQSPLELDKYPYLRNEIVLIDQAIKANKKVLGICLGAQLIAEALGAKTQHSPHKEIGEYPVLVLEEGKHDHFFGQLYPKFNAVHWHNDMPGINDEIILLAESEGCPQQAFRYKDRVYGFQFHLEPTLDVIEGMIKHCSADLNPGKYIRSVSELRATNYGAINKTMYRFLDYLAQLDSH